jgi:hypothetical protein
MSGDGSPSNQACPDPDRDRHGFVAFDPNGAMGVAITAWSRAYMDSN